MAIDRLKRSENLSIPDVVKELRDQRMHAVQNDQVSLLQSTKQEYLITYFNSGLFILFC